MDENSVTETRAFVAGLRELADFLDAHPDLPIPTWGGVRVNVFIEKDHLKAVLAAAPGVRWEKRQIGDYYSLRTSFTGDCNYDVNIDREQVCRKVVTGSRTEPAQPEREVEEFHWECTDSILAGVR